MRIYFDYYGNFPKYIYEDLIFGAIEFDTNGKHYIVDVCGEVDYDSQEDYIGGRIKGEYELLSPEETLTDEELTDIILKMDTSTFMYNLIEDGGEPDYDQAEIRIEIGDRHIEFSLNKNNKGGMYEKHCNL